MRRWSLRSAWLVLAVVPIAFLAAAKSQTVAKSVAVYDANPAHIWNRLYAALRVRTDQQGNLYGEDTLDPMLWQMSDHLLSQPSHEVALRVMDEFLRTHAETQIQAPLKRAMMQHDLWAVFDWSAEPTISAQKYVKEKRELQTRLAEVLRRLALTQAQIKSLPDNYAQTVASGAFAAKYDPAQPQRPFLPPDLFDPRGPWVCITPSPESFGDGSVARQHFASVSGRSVFFVFVRLLEGHQATLDYFQSLWNSPQPWVTGQGPMQTQAMPNPSLPAFPAGTEMALVRQMILIDDRGNLVISPVVESLQLRVYHEITTTGKNFDFATYAETLRRSGQDFYEFTISRSLLFAAKSGGLRATGPDDSEPPTFNTMGVDLIAGGSPTRPRQFGPTMESCLGCHSGGGLNSFNSLYSLLKPMRSQLEHQDIHYGPRYWNEDDALGWKQHSYDWYVLNGYWR